jgi:hypothetical protein
LAATPEPGSELSAKAEQLGLSTVAPRQHADGGKERMGGISKIKTSISPSSRYRRHGGRKRIYLPAINSSVSEQGVPPLATTPTTIFEIARLALYN